LYNVYKEPRGRIATRRERKRGRRRKKRKEGENKGRRKESSKGEINGRKVMRF
jgi:hypothetical protein